MAVGYRMPTSRNQANKGMESTLHAPEVSVGPSTEAAVKIGRPSFPSLDARFSKPRAEPKQQHLNSSGGTDTHEQRLQDSEAATRGKGYELLAKAGYKGSGGLGPLESGITSPIPAWHNQGRMGIGSVPNQQPGTSSHSASRAGNLSMKEISHGPVEGSNSSRAASQQQQQPQKRSKPPHKEWANVRVEEDLQVKVKRVKQVVRAEAEAAAEKALAKALYREFNDVGGQHSPDTNPLLRRSKLSGSNPLL